MRKQTLNSNYRNAINSLHLLVIEPIFDINKNEVFNSYSSMLMKVGEQVGLDLKEEILDFESNPFLIQKLSKKLNIDDLLKLSNILKMQIFFKLSKYRLAIFYQIQHDSLVSMTKNLNEDFDYA